MTALYIHVPFCDSICSYCDFCRVRSNNVLIEKWLCTLKNEMEDRLLDKSYDTIYLGGGTPTCLSVKQLKDLLLLIKPLTESCVEYTIEANPESLTVEKIEVLSQFKINRVSLGVQSTNNDLLNEMNRNHTKEDVQRCITNLKLFGITNISCDCMYSLPNQVIKDIEETLDDLIEMDVTHISIYSLTIEEHSEFGRKGIKQLDEDTEADMYDFIIKHLLKNGFYQYEISNFAKLGYESRHNMHYWSYDDFVGISIGASGKEEHCRYECTKNFEEYFKYNYIQEIIKLSNEDEMFEMMMMGLRLSKGMDCSVFQERFKVSFDEVYGNEKNEAIKKGLLVQEDHMLKCTEYGFKICNTVLEMFMK